MSAVWVALGVLPSLFRQRKRSAAR